VQLGLLEFGLLEFGLLEFGLLEFGLLGYELEDIDRSSSFFINPSGSTSSQGGNIARRRHLPERV
jgi:hypothetical protein